MRRYATGVAAQLIDAVGAKNKLRELAGMMGCANAATFEMPNMLQEPAVIAMFADYLTSIGVA